MKLWDRINNFCYLANKKDISCLDVMLFTSSISARYILQKPVDSCFLFVNKDSSIDAIISRMSVNSIKPSKNVRVHIINKPIGEEISTLVKERGWKNIGFQYSSTTCFEKDMMFKKVNKSMIIPVMDNDLRRCKTNSELKIMKEAASISVEIARKTRNILKKKRTELTELDIVKYINKLLLEQNCSEAFPSIVACGKNGIHPHAHATNNKLENGKLITIDFGATYKGYASDMTRTFSIGKPSKNVENVYLTVLEAHDKAVEQLKAGVSFVELHNIVVKYFDSKGVKDKYIHGLGHGVGLEVHEAPSLRPKERSILIPNDVITIEPGLYNIHSTGCRFENEYVVKKNGFELLTNASRELVV